MKAKNRNEEIRLISRELKVKQDAKQFGLITHRWFDKFTWTITKDIVRGESNVHFENSLQVLIRLSPYVSKLVYMREGQLLIHGIPFSRAFMPEMFSGDHMNNMKVSGCTVGYEDAGKLLSDLKSFGSAEEKSDTAWYEETCAIQPISKAADVIYKDHESLLERHVNTVKVLANGIVLGYDDDATPEGDGCWTSMPIGDDGYLLSSVLHIFKYKMSRTDLFCSYYRLGVRPKFGKIDNGFVEIKLDSVATWEIFQSFCEENEVTHIADF